MIKIIKENKKNAVNRIIELEYGYAYLHKYADVGIREEKGEQDMGLASSQARLMNLTARMHDIEYRAQNLQAQKLQMANESRHVYQEYEDALNKQKVQHKSISSTGEVTFQDFNYTALTTAGYTLLAITSTGGTSTVTSSSADATQLSDMLASGMYILEKTIYVGGSSTTITVNIATDTDLQEVQDESYLKKAEAKYEASMRQINAKDKKFDTDLAALDNERTAIKTEMETLKTVAKDNVDRTFKLFS